MQWTAWNTRDLVLARNLNARFKRLYPKKIYLIMQKIHSPVTDRVDFWIKTVLIIANPLMRPKVVAQTLTGVWIPCWAALSIANTANLAMPVMCFGKGDGRSNSSNETD